MSTIDPTLTVGELVAARPRRSRVFESHRIDYCCGGGRSLSEACAAAGADLQAVLAELAAADAAPAEGDERDWTTAPLSELADHIVAVHHAYLRAELPRLAAMTRRVAEVHGERHPELAQVAQVFAGLQAELDSHMFKEEQILFPLCRQLEQATGPQSFHCGSIANPIRVMEMEHDNAGAALAQMRSLTGGYVAPEDACNTYRAMLDGLAELEADLHLHIHKENNILFPRALAAEAAL